MNMQRQKFFVTGASSAAALLLAAATGAAPALADMSQVDSDADVWRVRGRLDGMISQLNGLLGNYNGNRVSAITALQAAKNALDGAVDVRGMNGALSDAVIRAGLQETKEMIERLNGDRGNYNGKKQQAIDNLTTARASLQAALRH